MTTTRLNELLNRYENGYSTIQEEKELKDYFLNNPSSDNFQEYKAIFAYYEKNKSEFNSRFIYLQKKKNTFRYLRIAASLFIGFILFYGYMYYNTIPTPSKFETNQNTEEMFIQTKKALEMVSVHLNSGMNSVHYLEEYETTRKIVFKK